MLKKSMALGAFVILLTLVCPGCVCTEKVSQKAGEHPAYALLFPLALPADLIVSPIVGLIYIHDVAGTNPAP